MFSKGNRVCLKTSVSAQFAHVKLFLQHRKQNRMTGSHLWICPPSIWILQRIGLDPKLGHPGVMNGHFKAVVKVQAQVIYLREKQPLTKKF